MPVLDYRKARPMRKPSRTAEGAMAFPISARPCVLCSHRVLSATPSFMVSILGGLCCSQVGRPCRRAPVLSCLEHTRLPLFSFTPVAGPLYRFALHNRVKHASLNHSKLAILYHDARGCRTVVFGFFYRRTHCKKNSHVVSAPTSHILRARPSIQRSGGG